MEINEQSIKEYIINQNPLGVDFIPDQIKLVGRGALNINYYVAQGNKEYVFRFNVWPHRLNREESTIKQESGILKELSKADLAPNVFTYDDSKTYFSYDFLIEEYILSVSDSKPEDIVKYLKKLHNLADIKVEREEQSEIVSTKSFTERLDFIKVHNETFYNWFHGKNADIGKYLELINQKFTRRSIVHGDPSVENFIRSSKGLIAIDWQTTFMGDPIFDLAYFLWDFPWKMFAGKQLDDKTKLNLLSYYTENNSNEADKILEDIKFLSPYMNLNMIIEIEFRYWLIQSDQYIKIINSKDRDFILNQRIKPAKEFLVVEENILTELSKLVELNKQLVS